MTAPTTTSTTCPNCGAAAEGRFCSSCGTALSGAVCATCSSAMTPGSRYCHRCGTPAGATPAAGSRGFGAVLPWGVAALALASLIALVVGQRFGQRPSGTTDVLEGANGQGSTVITAPGAPSGQMPRAPDISQMTPAQRAERLYDRIMRENEAGNRQAVQSFMPMAVAAFEELAPLNLDQRYDLGRLGEVGGDPALAKAQSDTILAARPNHLLGLALGARVARASGNEARARELEAKLVAAEPKERNAGLAEYLLHRSDIDNALTAAKSSAK
jgi:hypothetical protein